MIKSKKDSLDKEMKDKKNLLELRVKNLDKQEAKGSSLKPEATVEKRGSTVIITAPLSMASDIS